MNQTIFSRGTWVAALIAIPMALYAFLVRSYLPEIEALDMPVFETALALGTGLLLAVRINRAYERWWEARTLWGRLVNVSRNLAAKAKAYMRPTSEEAVELCNLIAGFADALKGHLRQGVRLQEIRGFEDETDQPPHVPLWLASRIFVALQDSDVAHRTTPEQLWPLDREARELMDVCGACERIRNTPMPPSLGGLTRVLMFWVAAALPWILHDQGDAVLVACATGIGTFFLFVVETTASVIERPFGQDPNQLRLTRLCSTIRQTSEQALGVS